LLVERDFITDTELQLRLFSDFSEIWLKNLISVGLTKKFDFGENAPKLSSLLLPLGEALGDLLEFFLDSGAF
jgi:hypothetical protein